MPYCQIVVGAPGSGKSTYCNGMQQFMKAIGREAVIVNIDPANEQTQYACAVNVTELITVDDVMREHGLGPNGGLIFCMEWLDKNMHLLKERLVPFEDKYILFDFPGQAELYTHNVSLRSIVAQIQQWGYLPVAVHLADAHLCVDPANFVAGLMMSLSVMCHLELPHVNVLSKVDLVPTFGRLPFRLDFYTEVMDLTHLTRLIDPFSAFSAQAAAAAAVSRSGSNGGHSGSDDGGSGSDDGDGDDEEDEDDDEPAALPVAVVAERAARRKEKAVRRYIRGHRRLNKAIAELVQDYALVSFRPLSVTDKAAMNRVLHAIDRANGYLFRQADLAAVAGLDVGVSAGDAYMDYASPDTAAEMVQRFDASGAAEEAVTEDDKRRAAAATAEIERAAVTAAAASAASAVEATDGTAELVSRLGGLQIRTKEKQ